MTKIEKNLMNAIEDAIVEPAKKIRVDGAKESGKGYYVSLDNADDPIYTLFFGKEKVATVSAGSYSALVVEMFAAYIRF